MNEKSDRQVPGFYRKRLGDVLVTALCDGYLDADIGVLQDISREEINRILLETFRPSPPRLSVNASWFSRKAGRR